jgi:hypothetical protein
VSEPLLPDADILPDPGPEDEARRSPRKRPPNYLHPTERRRLMWQVMPWAVAVVIGLSITEWVWFRPPPVPPEPHIDTALEAVRGPDPTGEAVRLDFPDLDPADDPFAIDPQGLSASPEALGQVRDDTFFREADMDAWLQTWRTLRDLGPQALAKAAVPQVSFAELFGQPRSFRGRLVRFKGTLHRVEELRAPENHYGIESYWQGWLEPASGPAAPVVLQFLERPAGMPVGMKVHEAVGVTGFFFKRYAYAAADTVRVAPLVMTIQPRWMPLRSPGEGHSWLSGWALATLAAAIGVTLAAGWLASRGPGRRPAPLAVDVVASLDGFEPVTPEESLRRLAASVDESRSVSPPGTANLAEETSA